MPPILLGIMVEILVFLLGHKIEAPNLAEGIEGVLHVLVCHSLTQA